MDFDKSLAIQPGAVDELAYALAQLQHGSASAQGAYGRARIAFAFAQFDAALAALAEVTGNAEVSALRRACYLHLAHWSLETGDLARAEWAAEQHLREDNASFQGWAVRGEAASLRGDEAAALECFNYALGALPREYAATPEQARAVARLLYLRVAALIRLRRYSEALEHWRTALERDTENADLWYLGALCRARTGQQNEALRLCLRALALDARHLDAGKLKRQLTQTT